MERASFRRPPCLPDPPTRGRRTGARARTAPTYQCHLLIAFYPSHPIPIYDPFFPSPSHSRRRCRCMLYERFVYKAEAGCRLSQFPPIPSRYFRSLLLLLLLLLLPRAFRVCVSVSESESVSVDVYVDVRFPGSFFLRHLTLLTLSCLFSHCNCILCDRNLE
ncbi:hypothetical protein DENSPDRAFT_119926 [Dentipellis sp. KUC8613]|nr:hypothetical protein DENSPDRAFT_119926 [Dentipellis sp. KUC8613]